MVQVVRPIGCFRFGSHLGVVPGFPQIVIPEAGGDGVSRDHDISHQTDVPFAAVMVGRIVDRAGGHFRFVDRGDRLRPARHP